MLVIGQIQFLFSSALDTAEHSGAFFSVCLPKKDHLHNHTQHLDDLLRIIFSYQLIRSPTISVRLPVQTPTGGPTSEVCM